MDHHVHHEQHHKVEEAHDKHAGHKTEAFLRKFWVSFALTIPAVLYSDITHEVFGWRAPAFFGSYLIPFAFGSIVFLYGGWVFVRGAFAELRARLPGMMTLITLAISTAYLYSVYATFAGTGDPLFWELTTLVTIMLLGHWVEMRAVSGAQGALKELAKLIPDTAERVEDGHTAVIPVSGLMEGDTVLVRPGARVPADGIVSEGDSDVNEAMVTGESAPVAKHKGIEVIAGTVNGAGALYVKVSRTGAATYLAGVMRLVAEAQASKSRMQILSDKAALYLTVIALSSGAITFTAWLFVQAGVGFALERFVAVLVIACPHALGLAVPLVAAISTTLAARNGFLVRDRLSLERARLVSTVLFDKTGTLTKGEFGVERVIGLAVKDTKEALRLAASIEVLSEHFLAIAIVKEAERQHITPSVVRDFQSVTGRAVKGTVDGKEVYVGGYGMLEDKHITLSSEAEKELEQETARGKTVIFVVVENSALCAFVLVDVIREESREAVAALKAMGVRIAMITGDAHNVAAWVSAELGIDEYFAGVKPEQKAEKVKILQGRGQIVAMVGDGINDAPALTQADVGIAVGAGTNVAIESAGVILARSDPRDISRIIRLSRLTFTKMVQNLLWATGYNIVALPLAAGAFAAQGVILEPAYAAALMSLSTVIVALNAVLLRRNKLE